MSKKYSSDDVLDAKVSSFFLGFLLSCLFILFCHLFYEIYIVSTFEDRCNFYEGVYLPYNKTCGFGDHMFDSVGEIERAYYYNRINGDMSEAYDPFYFF